MAAAYLQRRGHVIVDRNWRTRAVEIDIVSERQGRLYFSEVKYRRNYSYGVGSEYVTPGKVERIRRGVQVYLGSEDRDVIAQVISVSGADFIIDGCVEIYFDE